MDNIYEYSAGNVNEADIYAYVVYRRAVADNKTDFRNISPEVRSRMDAIEGHIRSCDPCIATFVQQSNLAWMLSH